MEVKPVILVGVACDLAKELSSVCMKGFTPENGLMNAAKMELFHTMWTSFIKSTTPHTSPILVVNMEKTCSPRSNLI
jgi:hypothetical protein